MRYWLAAMTLGAMLTMTNQASAETTVAECVARGIAYFKEIGSYPTLSDGRDAATVAFERCSRTTTAFPEM